MRSLIPYAARAFAILLLLAVSLPLMSSRVEARSKGAGAVVVRARPATDQTPAKCCFTNPGYAGTCAVEPAKDETCAQILAYLNNPTSSGKSYCGNTSLRGGWASVSCEKAH